MKIKLISILLVIFTIFAASVSAERYVDWQFREATIQSDGSISYSDTAVTDVENLGFICSDAGCNTISGSLRDGAATSSGASDTMQLTYPTADSSVETYGYGEYFYKEGYITWEQNPSFWGTSADDPAGPYTIYLTKKESCNAPIDTFSVLNDVQPNIPLVIGIDASLDATTYSAIHAGGPLNYVPSALESHYSVDTRVTLTIRNSENDIVFQEVQDIEIPYSGSQRVEFTWTPADQGEYTATAETYVTDEICLSSASQETSKEFTVLEEEPTNMCYTLLNNLATNDQFPSEGETLDIYGVKTSNYADDVGALTSIPTDLTLTITRQSDNEIILTESTQLEANDNSVDPSPFDFSWEIPAVGEGWYDISVTGIANSDLCNGLENLEETISVEVYVSAGINGAPTLSGIPDVSVEENTMPPDNWIDLWQYASDDLTADEDLDFVIVSQSNEELISCSIDSNQYIDCGMPAENSYGFSDITLEVSDGFYTDRDTFRVYVIRVQDYPVISNIPNVMFEVGSFTELDLDNYVTDANYEASELTWTYTGNENIQISIDPISHVARFQSPIWEGSEEITFTVTNPDGLTSSDISIATAYRDTTVSIENRLVVRAHINGDDHLEPGEMLMMGISVENVHSDEVEDIQISTIAHEVDMRDSVGPFDLGSGDVVSKKLYMPVPEDIQPGIYSVRLSISNDNLRRVIYREFIVE